MLKNTLSSYLGQKVNVSFAKKCSPPMGQLEGTYSWRTLKRKQKHHLVLFAEKHSALCHSLRIIWEKCMEFTKRSTLTFTNLMNKSGTFSGPGGMNVMKKWYENYSFLIIE